MVITTTRNIQKRRPLSLIEAFFLFNGLSLQPLCDEERSEKVYFDDGYISRKEIYVTPTPTIPVPVLSRSEYWKVILQYRSPEKDPHIIGVFQVLLSKKEKARRTGSFV